MNIDDIDDYKISFNPHDSEVDEQMLLEALKPYAVFIEKKSETRFEAVLNDWTPDADEIQDIAWIFIQRLGEHFPNALVTGHIEKED